MVTPNEQYNDLAKTLELSELYFKREDLHPFGSHKGRSIPVMMQKYVSDGYTRFAISSSGNAAISAALFTESHNRVAKRDTEIFLQIFVGKNVNKDKLEKIKNLAQQSNEHITVTHAERPLQSLFNATRDTSVKGLRQSNDDTALEGYKELAIELINIANLKAVFIPTSSGTTAQALAEAFEKMGKKIEIHIVQTMSCHPFTDSFTDIMQTDEISIADAIVDHTALRRDKLTELVRKSGGNGYVVTNEELLGAIKITEQYSNVLLSPNSALSLAGVMQAVYTGKKWNGAVACLITGN